MFPLLDDKTTQRRLRAMDTLFLLIDDHGFRSVETWLRNYAVVHHRVPRERIAPLMEHAPELLAAAQVIVGPWKLDDDPFRTIRAKGDAVERLRAVVAKVEGR